MLLVLNTPSKEPPATHTHTPTHIHTHTHTHTHTHIAHTQTLYAFLFENVTKNQLSDETFKIRLFFDFCKSSTESTLNEDGNKQNVKRFLAPIHFKFEKFCLKLPEHHPEGI